MSESVTQWEYVKAPMNLSISDRKLLLNIILRDMQAGGARIMSVRMVSDGWEVEYMGEPEVVLDGSLE